MRLSPNYSKPTRQRSIITSALLLVLLVAGASLGEEVELKSGKKWKGAVRSIPGGIALKQGRKEKEIGWADIDWIVHRTRPFVFRSRVTPEKTRSFAEAFQKFSEALPATFQFKAPLRKNWTVQVRIFRNEENYKAYEAEHTRDSSGSSCGYFWIDPDRCLEEVVVMDLPRDPGETFDTLLHESTHLFLYLWGKAKEFDFPIWMLVILVGYKFAQHQSLGPIDHSLG